MLRIHRAIVVAVVFAVFAVLASAQGNPLTCTTYVTVTPALRGEGYTESTGDIAISCTGGTTLAPGTAIPSVNITIFYNTNVTSRLLPTVGDPATNNVSEALLLIDEPGSGLPTYGSSLPQLLCTTPLVGCLATVGAVPGPTLGTAVSSGSTPAPNVYQGVVNGNSLVFFGVPVLPPGATDSRVFRITNVRLSAQYLAGGQIGAPAQAAISISGGISMPIQNPSPIVGFVSNGLTASAGSAANLSQCSSQTKTSVNTLTFTENFGTAFKTRVLAQTSAAYAGQINNPIQNIPGAIYNAESGFVLPINSTQVAGLADYGTRLKASFISVPPGARIFVSTANVNNNGLPVTAPNPIGGAAGNANAQAYVGYAQLVNGEASSDGNSGTLGFLPAVPATDYGPLNGNVPISEIPIIAGSGTAVWEVVNTNPNTIESFKFAVYVTYAANVPQNTPPPGYASVNLSFAATAISGVAADAGTSMPRFAADNSLPTLFTVQSCNGPSLSIAKTHTGNFTQGQSNAVYTVTVSNQAGAGPTSGTVTVTETVPTGLTLVSMAGPATGWTCPPGSTTCTRSDVLSGGSSYPPITVTVNVASNATSPLVNSVSVSGGGAATANATDSTTISPAVVGPVSVAPSTGNLAQQTFNLRYSDTAGVTDLSTEWVWFDNSSASSAAGSCLAYYSRSGNALYLLNDAGSAWVGPMGLGAAGTLSNSQCTINAASSSVSNVSGTDNVVNLAMTFASSFSGTKNVKMHVEGNSGYNGWQIMGTWTVPGVAVVVAPVSVAPSTGNLAQQTFNLRYSDTAGVADLSTEWVWFDNSSASSVAGSCLAYYSRSGNALYLLNDAGSAWVGPMGLGAAGTLSNSQCTINGPSSSVSNVSGTDNVVNLAMTFASSFSGTKNVKMHVEGSSGYNGWQIMGTWTVPGVAVVVAPVSVTPSSGNAAQQTFNLRYSDTAGINDLSTEWVWFDNSSASSVAGSCLAYYSRSGNALYLLNDAGSAWLGPVGMGAAGTLSNSQCAINTAASSVSNVSGSDNVVNLAITFASSFGGTKNVKMHVEGSSGYNGWQIMGTWTVPGAAVVVAPVSVTPSSGNAAQQTFNLRYSDTAGTGDLSTEWVWFDNSSASNVAGSCVAYYYRSANALYLLNDAGSAWLGPVGVGTAGTLSNSQCTINTAATSVSNVSGTDNVVNLAITFASSFSGAKNVKMHVEGSSGYNGWQIMGTWTVPGVAVVVAPVSVTPSSGNVAQQTFNLRYSDTAGINDLSTEWVWFDNSSASNVAGSCVAYYSRSGNALYLLNDAGSAWLGPVGVGTAGTLSNSQCAINTAATSVSNVSSTDNVVNLAVTFASSFSGAKNVKMHVEGSSGYNGWQIMGSWTVPGI